MSGGETIKQCQLCSLKTTSMTFLLRHLAAVHSNKPGFNFACGLNGCQRTYRNISTYRNHVSSTHASTHTNIADIPVVPLSSDSESDIEDGGEGVEVMDENIHATQGKTFQMY